MAYKSVEKKVLTVQSKNLNMNSLIETAALYSFCWQALSSF
jgi:hypothetical protein